MARGWLGIIAAGAVLLIASCAGSSAHSSVAKNQNILLVPPISAGTVGWCMVTLPEGGCAAGRSRPPIVAETWVSNGSPAVALGYALTTGRVAYVSINGRSSPIPTTTKSGLPDGLRMALIKISGLDPERERLPRFTPLDAEGRGISQSAGRGVEIRQGVLAKEVPVTSVRSPMRPGSGVCRIEVQSFDGITANAGSVIITPSRQSGFIGQGYLACASTSYNLKGWPLLASVLLDADHPGVAPPPLPYMQQPLPRHPGIFMRRGRKAQDLKTKCLHAVFEADGLLLRAPSLHNDWRC
jgi:hypothetical protein